MGSCFSNPTEKVSHEDYRNMVQDESKIEETKNDGVQVSKTRRQVTKSYNDSSRALKDDNMVILNAVVAAIW